MLFKFDNIKKFHGAIFGLQAPKDVIKGASSMSTTFFLFDYSEQCTPVLVTRWLTSVHVCILNNKLLKYSFKIYLR